MKLSSRKTPAAPDVEKSHNRVSRRRINTRARLLEAAYHIMSEQGVDATKIQDVTEKADVGFGTFYNYFQSKDELAEGVLDCVINTMGRRNDIATASFRASHPQRVMPLSTRLVLREALADPMWEWWVRRPDLLATRMHLGFAPFVIRDLRDGLRAGFINVKSSELEMVWSLAVWMQVGGLHDILTGRHPKSHERVVAERILLVVGYSPKVAEEMSRLALPESSRMSIDFSFSIPSEQGRPSPVRQ